MLTKDQVELIKRLEKQIEAESDIKNSNLNRKLELKEELDKIEIQLNYLNSLKISLSTLMSWCDHDWEKIGSGHRDDYYKCKICGAREVR